jgi:hypothetical protein
MIEKICPVATFRTVRSIVIGLVLAGDAEKQKSHASAFPFGNRNLRGFGFYMPFRKIREAGHHVVRFGSANWMNCSSNCML